MLYAQIIDRKIVNIIALDDSNLETIFNVGFDALIRIDELEIVPGIDWTYDGEVFHCPQMALEIPDVTPRQIRQALIVMGIPLSSIDDALNSLSDPMKSLARVEWEYSISFQRQRPLVNAVGQILGWSSEQLDALWLYASKL